MSLLDRLEGRSVKTAMTSLELFREIYGGRAGWTGKVVDWQSALRVSTVLACARVISEGIAQVPLKLIKESADGKVREPAKDHALYHLLHRKPNFFQTSFEYRETVGLHAVLCGSHYSYINRVRGEIYELLPFEPQCVTVKRDKSTWALTYTVKSPDGSDERTFPAEAIWHVRGPSWNGYLGLEAVQLAREAIGLAMATEESQATLHKNGARVGGLISVEGALSEKQHKDMHEWVAKHFEGSSNAGKTMILDRGSKFTSAMQTGVEAQQLETRRYQVEEICRALRVMPIMVGYSDKVATYASAEQMFLAHVVHTLSPWYERIEQSIDAHLLTEKDRRDGISAKFVEEGLLRGSLKDTKDYLLGLVNGGLMTPNEGRSKLDLNPDGDPESDKLRVPVNLSTEPGSETPPPEDPAAKALAAVHADVRALLTKDAQIKVEVAAPVVNIAPAAVTVNVPEQKAPDVKVEVAAPVVNMAPAEVTVNIEAASGEQTTTYQRDPESKEILSSTTKRA